MATIVLLEPQIPQNVGNIARLCVVTGTKLHLVGDLGFELSDKYLKRAAMDYWTRLDLELYEDGDEYIVGLNTDNAFLFSSKAQKNYTAVSYGHNSMLLFGNEVRGADSGIMHLFSSKNQMLRIPQKQGERCLNLAVAAGIAIYELLRQNTFSGLW